MADSGKMRVPLNGKEFDGSLDLSTIDIFQICQE